MSARSARPASWLVLSLCLFAACAAQAQSAADVPPEKPVGLGGDSPVGMVDLASHRLSGAPSDYALRARNLTLAPGGAIPRHAHAGRPGIVRVTKGTVVEYRGSTWRVLHAGDSWMENADTEHWFRNPSPTEPAELWAVDLVANKP